VRIRIPPSVAILNLNDSVQPGFSTIIDLINAIAKHKIQVMDFPRPTLPRSLISTFRLS
jgi:hypothetical protein